MNTMMRIFCVVMLCLVFATVAHADSKGFDYNVKQFLAFGVGGKYLNIFDGDRAVGPNLSIEYGVGRATSNGGATLQSIEIEAVAPKFGYSLRYFPPTSSPKRHFYLGKLGIGGLNAYSVDGVSVSTVRFANEYRGKDETIIYLSAAAGAGYHWTKHSTIEFAVSYTLTGHKDFIAAAIMLRGFIW